MKLLLVEDDRMLSALVRQAFMEEGHTVDAVPDGEQAEALVFANDYDAVVLDLLLPGKSGLELLQQMRRDGCSTPTLILTGRQEKADVVRGLDAGADDYLTKPFEVAELKARVRALLRRGSSREADRVSLSGLVLDRRRRQATVDGQALRMTPKEFALLEHLVLNVNDVVTRTELLEKVWELHFDPGSNVVDVHVGRLRTKLKDANVRVRLDTVRGIGFVLLAGGAKGMETA